MGCSPFPSPYSMISIIFFCFLCYSSAWTPLIEISALESLYNSTYGENWLWRGPKSGSRWSFYSSIDSSFNSYESFPTFSSPSLNIQNDPCSSHDQNMTWQGIVCSDIPINCRSKICVIISLDLSRYGLKGILPSQLGDLKNLTTLHLETNRLNGLIPKELGQLSHLQSLNLAYNWFSQTIPSELGKLNLLRYLDLYFNILTGAIPMELGSLSLLTVLFLNINSLSGPIPGDIGKLVRLTRLSLASNRLTGTIPSEIGAIVRLVFLDLSQNYLSEHIPTSIYQISELETLYLGGNSLTGNIPSGLKSLTRLTLLFLNENYLSGAIPSELGGLSEMSKIAFDFNYLTETIPPEFTNLSKLRQFSVRYTYVTGSLLPAIGSWILLEDLSVSYTFLTGSIPSEISNLHALTYLDLRQSQFSGEIKFQLHSLPNLNQIYLQGNHLSGHLHFFTSNMTNSSQLVNFDASENLFSGTIPDNLFLPPSLQSVSLSINCFEHELPSSVCQGEGLLSLSMDGLQAAKNCPNQINLPLIGVPLTRAISGTIPSCVWMLSTLQTLNLAGNGLSGTIGTKASMSSLVSMTLSHNHLSGRIPEWLFQKRMNYLDLSHNKLTGVIQDLNVTSSQDFTLKLTVNRLSGALPQSVSLCSSLDILVGNLFGCDYIPNNDPNAEWLNCGSKEYDQAMLFLGGIFFLVSLVSVVYFSSAFGFSLELIFFKEKKESPHKTRSNSFASDLNRLTTYARSLHQMVNDHRYHHLAVFCELLTRLIKVVWNLCGISLIFSISFLILKSIDMNKDQTDEELYFVTHDHMYRWLWSLTFLKGTSPALIIISMVFVCLTYFLLVIDSIGNSSMIHENPRFDMGKNDKSHNFSWKDWIFFWMIFFLNIGIVGTVNGLYIWSLLIDLGREVKILIQIAHGLFSSVWTRIILRQLFPGKLKESQHGVWLFTSFNVLNLIISCVVTALSSPNCYQRLLIPPDEITSSYSVQSCNLWLITSDDVVCIHYVSVFTVVESFVPPFIYSYQCGSSLLTYYIPVYLYSISFQLIGITVMFAVVLLYDSSSLSNWLMKIFPRVFWSEFLKVSPFVHGKLIDPSTIISDIINNILLFLTFGLCSPVLGVYIIFSTSVMIYVWLILLGRFVFDRIPTDHSLHQSYSPQDVLSENYLILLNHQLENSQTYLRMSKWPVVFTSCLLMTLLCWDVVGDEVKWQSALWTLIVGAGMMIVLILLDQQFIWICSDHTKSSEDSAVDIPEVTSPIRLMSDNQELSPLSFGHEI